MTAFERVQGNAIYTPSELAEREGISAPPADSFWPCPTHGGELVYLNERNSDLGDWEEHWSCPVSECKFERHVS